MKGLCSWWFCRRREKELRFRERERKVKVIWLRVVLEAFLSS